MPIGIFEHSRANNVSHHLALHSVPLFASRQGPACKMAGASCCVLEEGAGEVNLYSCPATAPTSARFLAGYCVLAGKRKVWPREKPHYLYRFWR